MSRRLSLEDSSPSSPKRSKHATMDEVYLDTIDRKRLDFDFEKICSVTLSNVNVYGCLVCGKYFQGRSPSSIAFNHSINEDHHVFISFNNLKTYILPENYEVKSLAMLNDIKYQILPNYSVADLGKFEDLGLKSTDLNGNDYVPGFVGLNNMKANDYSNVVIQALAHVPLLRDNLLLSTSGNFKNELNRRVAILVKKLWSSRLFKNHVSPHELLQYISILSKKKFNINQQRDPKEFLVWFLNTLDKSLREDGESVISKAFQGKIQIQTKKRTDDDDDRDVDDEVKESVTKFWFLNLELPPMPVLKDNNEARQIPQVKLGKLLDVYRKGEEVVLANGQVRKYKMLKLPKYLILHFNRFEDKSLGLELGIKDRNQTMVDFPLEIEILKYKYRLISNIVHDVIESQDEDQSNWKIQLKHNSEWFEIENLIVKPKEKEFLFLSETYIQVWERV